MQKARIFPGLLRLRQRLSAPDSVGLAAQEGRDLDPLLISRQFLLVVIGGDGRLLTAGLRAFLRLFSSPTRHAVDQAADAKTRTLSGFRCGRWGRHPLLRLLLHRLTRGAGLRR